MNNAVETKQLYWNDEMGQERKMNSFDSPVRLQRNFYSSPNNSTRENELESPDTTIHASVRHFFHNDKFATPSSPIEVVDCRDGSNNLSCSPIT